MSAAVSPTSRTGRALQQVGLGLVLRLGAVTATFAATPVVLNILGSRSFGVWLVLLSVFQWFTLFDLGVAAGARNEIARAASSQDVQRIRRVILTGWYYAFLIALALFGVTAFLLVASPLLDLLMKHAFDGVNASLAMWLVVAGACVSFVAGYIQSVYAALEEASAFSLFALLLNASFLFLALLAPLFGWQGIADVALLYLICMLAANVVLTVRFFRRYPRYRPEVGDLDRSLRSQILGFGARIFIIQLAALVIFTTSRLMTSILLGPEVVVVYDAAFKIFSLVTMAHALVMTTLWSSFTQAWEKQEFAWIRKSLVRLLKLMLPLTLTTIGLALAAPWIVQRWLGSEHVGTFLFYALFAASTLLICWSNMFAYFLNGLGETRVQLTSAVLAGVINIPATYSLAVTAGLGLPGVVLGTLISLSFFSVLGPLQVVQLLKGKHE